MRPINELPTNVRERLEYFEFLLRFRGWASRNDLTEHFGIGEAAATRDIRAYRDNSGENTTLNPSTKKYEINEASFKPIFEIKAPTALSRLRASKLSNALGLGESDGVLAPPRLALPRIEVLENIVRAMASGRKISATYFSVENGESSTELFPLALFDNGMHWYVRAYKPSSEGSGKFKVYMLSRFKKVQLAGSEVRNDLKSKDHQWNRMVYLELIPHPNRKNVSCPETIIHNYNMQNGKLDLYVRAAVAGYWLKLWNVDCTADHSLKGYAYQLYLNNHETLYDVESRKIAPGLDDDYPRETTENNS